MTQTHQLFTLSLEWCGFNAGWPWTTKFGMVTHAVREGRLSRGQPRPNSKTAVPNVPNFMTFYVRAWCEKQQQKFAPEFKVEIILQGQTRRLPWPKFLTRMQTCGLFALDNSLVAAPRTWNCLPLHLRLPTSSRQQFQSELKSHLFKRAYIWLLLPRTIEEWTYLLTYLLTYLFLLGHAVYVFAEVVVVVRRRAYTRRHNYKVTSAPSSRLSLNKQKCLQ